MQERILRKGRLPCHAILEFGQNGASMTKTKTKIRIKIRIRIEICESDRGTLSDWCLTTCADQGDRRFCSGMMGLPGNSAVASAEAR